MKVNTNNIKRLSLVNACFLLLPSYIFHYYLGLDINTIYAPTVGACLLIALHDVKERISHEVLALVLIFNVLGTLGSIFSGTYSQILMMISLSLNLIVAASGYRLFTDQRSLGYLLIIGWILVAGSVFAFMYALSGGSSVATIDLLGRESYFYITTFTNAVTGNLIRAAGIFDEPGALAMFVTLIVALNEAYRVNTKWSLALLLAGLVTGSFALFFIVISYLFFKGMQKKLLMIIVTSIMVVGLVKIDERASTIADEFFLKRTVIVDGRLSGDNRTHQIESFLKVVDLEMTLKGQKTSLKDYGGHDISSNPMSTYYGYGIFVWLPYAALLIWLLYCTLMYRPHLRFPAFALFLTLLQRPYLNSMYWGMMLAVLIVAIYRLQRETPNNHCVQFYDSKISS